MSGMRSAPRDTINPTQAVIGMPPEVYKPDNQGFQSRILKVSILSTHSKDRVAFSGGFKITEDYRVKRESRAYKKEKKDKEEDEDELQGVATKEEIFKALNISQSANDGGLGRHGLSSKIAINKDLVENIEKEVEKLKR